MKTERGTWVDNGGRTKSLSFCCLCLKGNQKFSVLLYYYPISEKHDVLTPSASIVIITAEPHCLYFLHKLHRGPVSIIHKINNNCPFSYFTGLLTWIGDK